MKEKKKVYEKLEWVEEYKGVRVKLDVPSELRLRIFEKILFEKACGRLPKKFDKVLLGEVEVRYFIMTEKWYIWGTEEKYDFFVIYASDYRPNDVVELPGLIDSVKDFSVNTTSFGLGYPEWFEVIKELME